MAVTRFAFKLADGNNMIDLAQCMSLVQRTMVRQKQNFTVLGGQVVDNADSTIKISTAPDFWYVRAAINRCFKAWKDQRSRTLMNTNDEDKGQNVGKFADFKISLDGTSTGSFLRPHYSADAGVTPIAAGVEWAHASVIPESAIGGVSELHFKILGPHSSNFYGAIHGWLQTRAIPNTSSEPDYYDLDSDGTLDYKQDFLNLLNETDDGQPERLHVLFEDNDNAPYALADVYGNSDGADNRQLQSLIHLKGLLGTNSAMVPGFKALCGQVHVNVSGGTNPVLFLDVLNTPEAF